MTNDAKDRFMLAAGTAAGWQGSAAALKDCAELVGNYHLAAMNSVLTGNVSMVAIRHLMTGGVFFFLAGLAIENLAKVLLVHRGYVKVTGGKLPGELKGHGIKSRLKRAKIAVSPDEATKVKKYEIAVSWAGRYPVPRVAEGMPPGSGTITSVSDVSEFLAFYNRLDALLMPPARQQS